MHQDSPAMRQRHTRLNWLNGAHFIVGVHQRHEQRVIGERVSEIIRIDRAPCPNRQSGDTKSLNFQSTAAPEYRGMLDLGGDDMPALTLADAALNSEVSRFCPTARQDHLFRPGTDEPRHMRAGLFDGVAGL